MTKEWLLEKLNFDKFPKNIVNAFSKVKRENFVPKGFEHLAYKDIALPIGYNQTISQPFTIAIMLTLLNLKENQKVLEIGSGCGYVLALTSKIVGKKGKVFGIEIIQGLAEESKETLANCKNVEVYNENGRLGLSKKAPFDRILISAALDEMPMDILNQLKNNGILVAPVGDKRLQTLIAIQKINNEFIIKNKIPGFVFVPFVDN
jgi:protein-L-isoaspartate(D-aspartate) O-methyltransferase